MSIDNFFGEPVFVDEHGRICLECPLCDSVHLDLIGHLGLDHASNPVAQRIVEEYRKSLWSESE